MGLFRGLLGYTRRLFSIKGRHSTPLSPGPRLMLACPIAFPHRIQKSSALPALRNGRCGECARKKKGFWGQSSR